MSQKLGLTITNAGSSGGNGGGGSSGIEADDNIAFTGSNSFAGSSNFTGATTLGGTNTISGDTTISGVTTLSGNKTISGATAISSNTTLSGNNTFSGTNTFNNTTSFTANTTHSGNNTFTGTNSFSDETSFTNSNPMKLITNGNTTQILFEENGSASTNAAINFNTSSLDGDVNGELTVRAHVLTLANSQDALQFDNNVGTFLAAPIFRALPTAEASNGTNLTPTNDKELATKKYVDDNAGGGSSGIVTGMIVIWSGAANAVPTGWVLCDGNNNTPNLSGKFVLGYGTTGSTTGNAKSGTVGNNSEGKIVETTHLPPIQHVDDDTTKPRVDHPASSGITSYTLVYSSNYDGNVNAGQNWIGLPQDHGAPSVAAQEAYYSPYYVLAYIMKT